MSCRALLGKQGQTAWRASLLPCPGRWLGREGSGQRAKWQRRRRAANTTATRPRPLLMGTLDPRGQERGESLSLCAALWTWRGADGTGERGPGGRAGAPEPGRRSWQAAVFVPLFPPGPARTEAPSPAHQPPVRERWALPGNSGAEGGLGAPAGAPGPSGAHPGGCAPWRPRQPGPRTGVLLWPPPAV